MKNFHRVTGVLILFPFFFSLAFLPADINQAIDLNDGALGFISQKGDSSVPSYEYRDFLVIHVVEHWVHHDEIEDYFF